MLFRRLALAVTAMLFASAALAASINDRSPFSQGHWWDSTRSGNGFELFNVGSEGMAIWYTFDDAGKPIWYTAQGAVGAASWPLLRHRWENGRKGAASPVGTLSLSVTTPESIVARFDIGGRTGTWNLEPFALSGNRNAVDHSGSYYDLANSGWGLTLTQQGDVLGGVLYTYDAAGAPTWFAGFDRESNGTVGFISATGTPPFATYLPTRTQSVGRIAFEFRGEGEMVLRNQLTVPMAAGVNVDGAKVVQLGRAASQRPADRELATVTDDTALKSILSAAMHVLPTYTGGGVDFSASPAPAAFSTTNLQEAGVDEADYVKTDGEVIYTFAAGNYGMRAPIIRAARVGNGGATVTPIGTVNLAVGPQGTMQRAGLYVNAGKLVSVTGTTSGGYYPAGIWGTPTAWMRGTTNIEVFQTSATGLPTSVWNAQVEGHLVSSRRIGDRLYIVARYVPYLPTFSYGAALGTPQYASNQTLITGASLADLTPKIRVNGGAAASLVAATSVHIPPQGNRPLPADMILVYAIDLASPRVAQSLSILGGPDAVYVSTQNLYVATSRTLLRNTLGALLPEPPFVVSDIHQVSLGADAMRVVASGSVEGTLGIDPDKAAFRISEHQGKVRVVTSSHVTWGSSAKNRVSILENVAQSPGVMRTVSFLPNSKRPESLGKPGEILYGVRFVGERLYAVTFKLIDPLYVVDLADAADPKIASALELPGFSEYLHPLPNGLLLGFGKDAVPVTVGGDAGFAWYQGLQLSLFDVSTTTVREIQRVTLGKRGSNSALMQSHHAFTSLERPDGRISISFPARIHDGSAPEYGSGPSAMYPWVESGLMNFDLLGTQLVQRKSLVTHSRTNYPQSYGPSPDATTDTGRSVLFANGTVFVGNGVFWVQDQAGNQSGPF